MLSAAQRRLWFLAELDPSSAAYLVPAGLTIDGALDAEALEWALQQVVARHEVLRTRIETVDGAPVVTIADAPFSLARTDLTTPAGDEQAAAVTRLATEEATTPLALSAPPLLRGRLLRLGDTRHVLLLTLHHIASDAWSMELLVAEAAALYDARRQQRAMALPPLALQYADVARWEQARGEQTTSIDYWRERLADVPPLALPHDHPRPKTPTLAGSSLTIDLPADAAALVRRARADGATPFMAFLAVFEVLLARWSGATDFAVGAPVANRERPEVAGLIGFFMNTLALRSDVAGQPTFAELLRRVRRTTLDAHARADVPFEQLVDRLQVTRELAHHPIFQATFTLQHAAAPIELPGLRIAPLPMRATTAKFDLTLAIVERRGGWEATFEYSTALFAEPTIRRMADSFARLVSAAAAAPERDVFQLDWLDAGEQQRARIAGPVIDHPLDTPVHDAVLAQAARTPDAIALVFEGDSLTYDALDRRSAALAAELATAGVRQGDRVGLTLDRSFELVIAMLAIARAGAAYVPIDPANPRQRLETIVDEAGASLIITSDGIQQAGQYLAATQRATATASASAYVLFTSGSTGRPKGVMIPHGALAHHMAWMQRVYPLGPGDRVLQKTPATFDASVWEFWAPLMTGATLVIARPDGHRDPDYLVDLIQRQRVTTLQAVPSLLRALLDTEGFRRCDSLRRVFAGGEALTRELQDRFFAASQASLINLYGPTEVTIDSIVWDCERDGRGAVPIGYPVDNTTAYVLDDTLSPVPGGVTGELYLAGPQLALGYVNQPGLTAQVFVPDPFAATPGARMYRTGDRVRRLASGALEYLGRADDQLKLRGVRIEPREIERVLEQHPAVRQAVVDLRVAGATRRLVAYVLPRANGVVRHLLRTHAQEHLPEHMVPADFVILDAFPTLPSGKVDRRRLPEPPREQAEGDTAPRDRRESILAAVWASVLGLDSVGIRDNFFTLGGDSILSLQVVARARAAGLTITPQQLFLHQTVEALAAVATERIGDAAATERPTGVVALTPIQEWFFDLDLPRPHHWNQALLLETPIGADARHIAAAIADVAARHDVFRLHFDGRTQRYADDATLPLETMDLRGREHELAAAIDRLHASIDLARAPLARAAFFDVGDQRRGRLLLTAHHLIIDGVSWRVLLDDLQVAYDARRDGRVPSFAAPTATFHAWSHRLADEAARIDDGERAFWSAQLAPAPRLRLDMPGGGNLESDARHVTVTLDEAATDKLLREAPAKQSIRPVDLMLAALADSLAPWLDSRTLLVDLESHGRDLLDVDLSRTVGWFTALYPVRLDLTDAGAGAPPAALIAAVKRQLQAVPRKGLGFGLLRSTLPTVHAEVAFDYQGQWSTGQSHGGAGLETSASARDFGPAAEPIGALRSAVAPRTHGLDVVAGVVDRRLQVRWTYSSRQYQHETAARMADGYRRALEQLIDHCLRADQGGYTPADFTAAGLGQRDLDKLLSKLRGV